MQTRRSEIRFQRLRRALWCWSRDRVTTLLRSWRSWLRVDSLALRRLTRPPWIRQTRSRKQRFLVSTDRCQWTRCTCNYTVWLKCCIERFLGCQISFSKGAVVVWNKNPNNSRNCTVCSSTKDLVIIQLIKLVSDGCPLIYLFHMDSLFLIDPVRKAKISSAVAFSCSVANLSK